MTAKEPAFARRLRYFYYHCSLLYSQIVLYGPALPASLYSSRNICARLRVTLSMLSVSTGFPALV